MHYMIEDSEVKHMESRSQQNESACYPNLSESTYMYSDVLCTHLLGLIFSNVLLFRGPAIEALRYRGSRWNISMTCLAH